MKRYSFSNQITDQMIDGSDSNWTRDVPNSAIVGAFPLRGDDGLLLVTPAKESAAGRGQPVFDVYNPAILDKSGALLVPSLISFKISKESRNPRSIVITTGKGDRHLIGVMRAVRECGTEIPLVAYNYIADEDQWYRLDLDVSALLRAVTPVEADGKRGRLLVTSKARRKSGKDEWGDDRIKVYSSLRGNVAPMVKAGMCEGWRKVDAPVLPERAM